MRVRDPQTMIPDFRVGSITTSQWTLEKPWSYFFGTSNLVHLYMLLEGTAWLSLPDESPRKCLPGTMVTLTKPVAVHWYTTPPEDSVGKKTPNLVSLRDDYESHFDIGSPDAPQPKFVVMSVPKAVNLLPDILRPVFIADLTDKGSAPGLWSLLKFLLRPDIRRMDIGDVLQKRIAEAMALLMTIITIDKESSKIVGKSYSYDERIRRILSALHSSLDHNWTVEEMAEIATMSRSGLSIRFKQLIGEAPLIYLTHLRMQKAATLLHTSAMTVNQVAGLIGYQSESSFNKAFVRNVGLSPGKYRKAVRKGEVPEYTGQIITVKE